MKKLIYILTSLIFCLVLANCSLFGGGEKPEEPQEPDTESADYYEAGSESEADDSDSDDDDEDDSGTATLEDSDDGDVDTDVAFGEPSDIPADTAVDTTPDMTPDTPDVMPEPEPEPSKSLASAPFKQGMYDFDEDCQMREDPDPSGSPAGKISAPKKLWVEPFDNNWLRVYKKSGPVFIKKTCLVK